VSETNSVIQSIRQALGRSEPLKSAPVAPEIPEHLVRLVPSDIGLPELFAKQVKANKMGASLLNVEALAGNIVQFLKTREVKKVALPISPLLERTGVTAALRAAGFDVRTWDQITLDELYDFDCAVTDVFRAVAETGSLVIRGTPEHGRALTLVPDLHVAVVEPVNIVPDLMDLFQQMTVERPDNLTLISGPSKTSDIELKLVTGVHGPGEVQVFILH
jgi:L-lactate dehydrogenase complex protein LldG